MSILTIENVSKSFSGNKVLSNINLSMEKGEIHSIIGENGAGKSTLMKIISGVYQADEGKILIDGEPVEIHNPMDAVKYGIAIVHQELSVAGNMSVAQNVFVNREPTTCLGFIDWKKLNYQTEKEFEKIGIPIKPEIPVSLLSVGMQQIVEIVKVLSENARILILDEPTSALSEKEINNLFGLLYKLRDQEKLIIFISHKLQEVKLISDDVSVLRDGKLIGTLKNEEIDENKIIQMMVGREINSLYPPKEVRRSDEIVLETVNLSRKEKFKNINIQLHPGEIVGLFGLIGSGRTEFAYSLFGADKADSGYIVLNGKRISFSSPEEAINAGIGYLAEDRKNLGLFLGMDVVENISAAILNILVSKSGFLEEKPATEIAKKYISSLEIHPENCEHEKLYSLSGGNQQKVLLSKWLAVNPKILIVDEPTRGVDVGAKAKIHSILRELANQNIAILMISSELPEILGLSDRIIVFHEGECVSTMENNSLTEEAILKKAFNESD